jgi:putative membrane protein
LIADEFAEELKNGNVAEAFVQAILKCGDLLAENFPAKKENPNELTDGLVILEDAEWF